MADIDVVPRSRSRAWVWWVLAIVAIAIVVIWLMNMNATDSATVGSLFERSIGAALAAA
jgi:hypothetical protein